MSRLVLVADGAVVTARWAEGPGSVSREAPYDGPRMAPEALWQAARSAAEELLDGAVPQALTLVDRGGTLVLWDVETLGAPVAAALADPGSPGLAPRLAGIARDEPRTWALVEEGRYVVGTLESYLLARLTRGVWHATDVSHARATGLADPGGGWSALRCDEAGVPLSALPEIVAADAPLATTDPRGFLGLAVPVGLGTRP